MPDEENKRPLMLIGHRQEGAEISIHKVRDLTPQETQDHLEHTRVAAEAVEHFSLFKILVRNFTEWSDYLRSLFHPGSLQADEKLELNRLLLNYLTCAKAVIDHFEIAYSEQFPETDQKGEFRKYLQRVREKNWASAFFQDFRNFVQHRGLPVGNFSRKFSETSITLHVQVDAASLVRDYDRWKYSQLTATNGSLDLVDLLRDYHQCTMQNVASFLARAFFPSLIPAHNFYAKMAAEVAKAAPAGYRMLLMDVISESNENLNLTWIEAPSNLFAMLGFKVFPKPEPTSDGQTPS